MSAVASAKPTKTTETTPHGSSRRCSPITKPAFSPRREHVFPRNHASRGRRTRPRRIQNPRSRLGESTIFPESTPRGGFRVPFVASVVASGCTLCRRWSLCGALLCRRWSFLGVPCAVGGRFPAPFVPSAVAPGRPLWRLWSLRGALCVVGGRFWTPFVPLVLTSGRPTGATIAQRPHVTVSKCKGAQM